MNELHANLWDVPADLRAITTNGAVRRDGACVMGRGCALEAKTKFPGIDHRLGSLIEAHGNRVMRLGRYDGVVIASFPVKHHWREEADPALIRLSCQQLVALADKFGYREVVVPRPGCGNGRLSWRDVRPILDDLLDGRFTVVSFPNKRPPVVRADDADPEDLPDRHDQQAAKEKVRYAVVGYAYDSADDLGRGRYRRTVHEGGYESVGEAGAAASRLSTEAQAAGALAHFDAEEYPVSLGAEHARPVKLRKPKVPPWMASRK